MVVLVELTDTKTPAYAGCLGIHHATSLLQTPLPASCRRSRPLDTLP